MEFMPGMQGWLNIRKLARRGGTCLISALWKAKVGEWLKPRNLRLAWTTWQNLDSTKNTKIRAWWCVLVGPTTIETEVGGWLELSRLRLQQAMTVPLPSSMGDTAKLCLKTKTFKNQCNVPY